MPRWPRRRRAARALVFDPSDRILLISASDPADRSSSGWWEIPGGGVDPGEATSDTAARELWEEAGIRDATIGPVVWTQSVQFDFGGWHFDQDEWIHLARCDGHTSGPGGLEALEALAFDDQRWWTADEILESGPRTIPYRLAEFLPALLEELALHDGSSLPHDPARAAVDITPGPEHVAAWMTRSTT